MTYVPPCRDLSKAASVQRSTYHGQPIFFAGHKNSTSTTNNSGSWLSRRVDQKVDEKKDDFGFTESEHRCFASEITIRNQKIKNHYTRILQLSKDGYDEKEIIKIVSAEIDKELANKREREIAELHEKYKNCSSNKAKCTALACDLTFDIYAHEKSEVQLEKSHQIFAFLESLFPDYVISRPFCEIKTMFVQNELQERQQNHQSSLKNKQLMEKFEAVKKMILPAHPNEKEQNKRLRMERTEWLREFVFDNPSLSYNLIVSNFSAFLRSDTKFIKREEKERVRKAVDDMLNDGWGDT